MSAKHLFYLMLSLAGTPTGALAGISSGGGFLPSDATNPWFLENTATVSYCIERDPESFHASDDVIRRAFTDALNGWKDAFRKAALNEGDFFDDFDDQGKWRIEPYGIVRVATQNFIETNDCANADLRLQLGILSEEQKQNLGDPRQSIGATYRTSYDTVRMKGKGFIYIAADSGPLRPTSSAFHDRPWELCDGCVLRGVLAHELGHVFGVTHGGDSSDDLEHELFPFFLTNKDLIQTRDAQTWKKLSDESRFVSVFRFNEQASITNCRMASLGKYDIEGAVFGTDIREKCIQFQVVSSDKLMIRVAVADSNTGPRREIGVIQAIEGAKIQSHSNTTNASLLYLPSEQKVFTRLPAGTGNLMGIVEKTSDQTYSPEYRGHDGKTMPIQVRLYPHNRLEITAVVEGQMRTQYFEEVFF